MPLSTLIVGARGTVGRHVLDLLLAEPGRVVVSSRRPEPDAFPAGVDVRRGDLTDPRSLPGLFAGVDQVFLYALRDGVEQVVEALDASSVRRVVLLSSGSVLQPQAADNPVAAEHRDVENVVARAVATVVPIRPLVLATNALSWAHDLRADRPLLLFRPDAGTAPIHERDVAAVAVAALTGRDDVSGILTGPDLLTQRQQIQLIGAALGRPVRIEEQSRTAMRTRLRRFLPDAEVQGVLDFLEDAARGGSPVTSTVTDVLGRPALSFSSWIADHVGDFR